LTDLTSKAKDNKMKIIKATLVILHLFIGLGALVGGLSAILNPQMPLGTSTELLANSPFTDYFIPGLFLFFVIGMGNLVSIFMLFTKSNIKLYLSGFVSVALVLWIVVQCYMLEMIIFAHVLFFSLGVVMGIMALSLMIKDRNFPFDRIFQRREIL